MRQGRGSSDLLYMATSQREKGQEESVGEKCEIVGQHAHLVHSIHICLCLTQHQLHHGNVVHAAGHPQRRDAPLCV